MWAGLSDRWAESVNCEEDNNIMLNNMKLKMIFIIPFHQLCLGGQRSSCDKVVYICIVLSGIKIMLDCIKLCHTCVMI